MSLQSHFIALTICGLMVRPAPLLVSAAEPGSEGVNRLRVLSYNIHHGEGVDGTVDLERIARVIKAAEPDIVALQEVDQNTQRTSKVDQTTALARLTGLQAVFGGNIAFQGGSYGNAVLSRLRVMRHKNHPLPSVGGGEQRGVLEVEFALPEGRGSLWILATHLDHRRDERERITSVGAINGLISGDGPTILAGDLNAVPDSAPLRALTAKWALANAEPLFTSPASDPRRQIDFVLMRPANRWRTIEVRVLAEAVASDHRPILAVLELISTQ